MGHLFCVQENKAALAGACMQHSNSPVIPARLRARICEQSKTANKVRNDTLGLVITLGINIVFVTEPQQTRLGIIGHAVACSTNLMPLSCLLCVLWELPSPTILICLLL